jgi:hypothetical protein
MHLPYSEPQLIINDMSSTAKLYVRPSALSLTAPPVPTPSLRVGTDEWTPWPMVRPKLSAHTDEMIAARARLDFIICDMLELQQKFATARIDEMYLQASVSLHERYQDWMGSLEHGLQPCGLASQHHILLQ